MKKLNFILFLSILLYGTSCTNDMKEVHSLFSEEDLSVEVARDVEIFYSDSAVVKIIIESPTMKRFSENGQSKDEFPDGIKVSFLNEHENAGSWLEADYAIRNNKDRKIHVKENVKFYNKQNEKLETSALIWDEGTGSIYTDKFVRITQPAKRDTSYGYGFKANEDFTKFEILNFQAVKNAEAMESILR